MNQMSGIETLSDDQERAVEFEQDARIVGPDDCAPPHESLTTGIEDGPVSVAGVLSVDHPREAHKMRVEKLVLAARAKKQAKDRAAVEPPPGVEPTTAGGGTSPPTPSNQSGMQANAKRLRLLSTMIRSEVKSLWDLLDDALARKLKLGQHLHEARGVCNALGKDWAKFIDSVGLKDRNAREAIQFFNRKDQIEQLRHGGAALNVSIVRAELSQPRKEATKSRARGPRARRAA